MDQFKQETGKGEKEESVEIRDFRPKNFGTEPARHFERTKNEFGKLLKTDSETPSPFSLNSASKRYLGIEGEEQRNLENQVNQEVEKREALIRSQAWAAGFEQGRVEGEQKAIQEFSEKSKPVYDRLVEVCHAFDQVKDEIYRANEAFLVDLVFQVSKKVLLKELKVDREYIQTLCAQVVEQIGARDHVKIKIGKDDFAQVEQIRDGLKQQFPDLKNIQIDVREEIVHGGCKVETDLARIDASVNRQLELIHQGLGEK